MGLVLWFEGWASVGGGEGRVHLYWAERVDGLGAVANAPAGGGKWKGVEGEQEQE